MDPQTGQIRCKRDTPNILEEDFETLLNVDNKMGNKKYNCFWATTYDQLMYHLVYKLVLEVVVVVVVVDVLCGNIIVLSNVSTFSTFP